MTTNNRFTDALFDLKKKSEPRNPLIAGSLGITLQGHSVVEVPNRASYVYVQVRSSTAEVIQAFNQTVSPVFGLPVFIQWQGNRYVVVERDTMRYSDWGDFSAYLPRHASTHEWSGSAGDVVFVSQAQFLPLMPSPSGSLGNSAIIINEYSLMTATGTFQFFTTKPTQNLTVWNPSSPTGAVMVLISLDGVNGNLHYDVNSGTVFGNWLTGTADVLPYVPAISDIGRYLPLAAVRLVANTTAITWANIYDVRQVFGASRTVAAGGGGGGSTSTSSGLAVLNNGLLENYATQLNLLGSAFILSHSGTQAQLNIVGGGTSVSGALALDTSNGPLYGPLVVYQQNPNNINQYFDRSTIVGYLSGTAGTNFAAGIEAVNFSTGINAYGLYVDDEGAGQALFAGSNKSMDRGPLVQFSHNIDGSRVRGRYFSDIIHSTRWGGGFPATIYVGAHLALNEQDTAHIFGHSIEVQSNFVPYYHVFPLTTGTPLSYPFPNEAAYYYDTARALPTGTVHSVWNQNTIVYEWIAGGNGIQGGMHFFEGIGMMEHTGSLYSPGNNFGKHRLTNGTVTVPSARVTASSRIFLTIQNGSGTVLGFPFVNTRLAGSGFTIRSSNLNDDYEVAWILIEPHIGR